MLWGVSIVFQMSVLHFGCMFYILDAFFLYAGCLFCMLDACFVVGFFSYIVFSYIPHETFIFLASSRKSVEALVFSWQTLVNPANSCISLADAYIYIYIYHNDTCVTHCFCFKCWQIKLNKHKI